MVIRNTIADSVVNGPVVQLGSGNVTLALARPDYALQWVGPGERQWLPPHQRTPSYLLDTRREIVPYRSRVVEERKLETWLAGDAPMSVLLIHGAGGSGKTRLANAFAGFASGQGWAVAQAVESAPAGDANSGSEQDPVLVVVDYAERWGAESLLRMVGALPFDFPGRSVRVLLLARSGAIWPGLADRLDRLPAELPAPIELGDLVPLAERRQAFNDAATAFARALSQPEREIVVPDLVADGYGSALTLHMAALAAAYDGHPGLVELSDYLLRHEGRFWPTDNRADAADTVFLATLNGPLDTKSARDLLDRAGLVHMLDWHDRLYPPAPRTALVPLRPDRFGEDFVARHLKDHPRAVELFDRVPPSRRCLIVLAAAAERHEHVIDVLFALLRNEPALAQYASTPLIDLLISHAPYELCAAVLIELPSYRSDLLDAAARLASHVVNGLTSAAPPDMRAGLLSDLSFRLRSVGDPSGALGPATEAVEIYERLADGDPSFREHLAGAWRQLSEVLSALDHRLEAVEAAKRSVLLFSELFEVESALGASVSSAMDSLARRLSAIGDLTAALSVSRQAVALAREQTDVDYLPNLASHLDNLAGFLYRLGEREEAFAHIREAITIARRLVAENRKVYLSDLARYTRNLGAFHGEARDTAAAVATTAEAVMLYRQLVSDQPAAYVLGLALTQANLSLGLAQQGDKARALTLAREAIGHLRDLVAHNPEAHLAHLGTAYRILATGQLESGAPSNAMSEAVEAARGAVDIFFHLDQTTPGVYAHDTAHALAVLADVLGAAGEFDEAAAIRETLATARLNGRTGDSV